MEYILSMVLFLPLVVGLLLGIMRVSLYTLKVASFATSLVVLLFVLALVWNFDTTQGIQFSYVAPWITHYGITYYIGVDAISLLLLLLIAFLMPLIYLAIWDEERKGYFYNFLLLQTGVSGVVVSLDLILFYLFWESMLLPVFIMIGSYGYGMRHFNAMKIIIMTVFGSMSMLLAILYLGYTHFNTLGWWSFAFTDLSQLIFEPQTSIVLAGAFLLAFAIKIPLFGLHTWMAPAYNSSPTAIVVILSAVMAKLGVYGLFRFSYTLFEAPLGYYTPYLIALALIGMIFYSIHAVMQRNLKRLFAFSSGSHLSLIALGLFVTNIYAWSGGVYLIATHAIASAGIFLMIGMLGRRTDDIRIEALGGIASMAPRFAFFFVFFSLAIVGIPGTGGFVAELLIIIGAFKYNFWVGVLSAMTMLGAILFIFWMLQRVIYGKTQEATHHFEDLDSLELLILIPLVFLLLITGIFPNFFMEFFEPNLLISLEALGGVQ
jgi:NADH-quinone oxidoreductase subunit M